MVSLTCLLFGMLQPGPTTDPQLLAPALRWPAREGTVRVVPTDRGGETGSAVCIAHRAPWAYLLTANHVIPDERNAAFEFFRENSFPKPHRRVEVATLVGRSAIADLAILKVLVGDEPPTVLPLAAPNQRPKRFPFEAVAVGCPARSAPEIVSQNVIAKKLVRQPKLPGEVAFFWQMSHTPVGGMSGGPLLDREGRIIGICVAHQEGKGYFTHADEILALLQDHSLGWIFEPPAKPEK